MYIYFDKQGVVKEIVNVDAVRVGSDNFNTFYFYFENKTNLSAIWLVIEKPDGNPTNEQEIILNKAFGEEIPYNKNQDLKYFKDYEPYDFYTYTLKSSDIRGNGLYKMTIRAVNETSIMAQGLITFNVENNVIKEDHNITQSQYDYLIEYVSQSVTQIKGSYVRRVDYDNATYKLTFTFQDDTQLIVDLPDEEQLLNIQQNKENIARLEQSLNTALNNLILEQDTYKLTATTVGGSAINLDLGQIAINKQDIGTLQNDVGSVKDTQAKHSADISDLKTKALQINTNTEDITALQTNDVVQDNRLLAIEQDVANINGNNVVKTLKQTLNEAQKKQARENIGVDVSQFILKTEKGARSGVATLDENGFLTASQIPSHLDEIVSGTLVNNTTFRDRNNVVVTPKEYCIYFDTTTKKRYGWSGTEFVELTSGGLVLGTTEGTAFDGGKGTTLESKVTTLENAIKPIPNKVDKISGTNQVYTTDGGITYSTTPTNDSIVRRTNDGRIKASRPIEDNDVITKAYMQEFGGKIDPVDLEKIIEGQNHITTELSSDKTKVIIKNDNTVVVNTDIASNDKLGLVKVGGDFDIAQDGTISLYKPIKILSFTNNIGSVAKGQTINEVILTWQTSKLPKSISIDGQPIVPNTTTTKTFSGLGLKDNKTFTLKVEDNRGKMVTSFSNILFSNYVLYGTGTTFNENLLIKVLKTTRVGVYEVNAKANEHIYFSIPASLGLPTFFVGGFEGGFVLDKTYNWDNGFGYTESYNVYKSSQVALGVTKVEVK